MKDYDSTSCLDALDSVSTVLVGRTAVVSLTEAVNALLIE